MNPAASILSLDLSIFRLIWLPTGTSPLNVILISCTFGFDSFVPLLNPVCGSDDDVKKSI